MGKAMNLIVRRGYTKVLREERTWGVVVSTVL